MSIEYLLIDTDNSKNIHKYFNKCEIWNILDLNYKPKKHNMVWFANNFYSPINNYIEKCLECEVVINNQNLKNWELNRRVGIERAKVLGVKIPKTVYDIKDLDFEKGIIKPNLGSGYKSSFIFQNKEELERNFENFEYKDYIIQEYIEGNEIAFGCFFIDSKPILPVYINREYKRSISKNIGGNTGQSAEFGLFSYHLPPFFEKLSYFLIKNNVKYNGLIDINFMERDNELYFLEFTISRDGYPEILAFLSEKDFIPALLEKRDFKIENKFNYSMIIRVDDIELEEKEIKIAYKEKENIKFIPEVNKKDDLLIVKENDMDNIGILYKRSNEFEELELIEFSYPVLYYIDYNEEIKKDWEYIKKYDREWKD